MKTFLKILVLVYMVLYFTACGGEGGSSDLASPPSFIVGDPIYTVKVRVDGNYACSFITNFGDADQGELLTGVNTLTAAQDKEWSVTGRNLVGQCSQSTGGGLLEVEVYRYGTLYEIKTNTGNLTSVHFSVDI